jgi:hypothetical protein
MNEQSLGVLFFIVRVLNATSFARGFDGLSSGVAVWSIHEERGVFGAHRRARSQFTNDSDHVDGYVRTIGPVTKILGESFSVAVD